MFYQRKEIGSFHLNHPSQPQSLSYCWERSEEQKNCSRGSALPGGLCSGPSNSLSSSCGRPTTSLFTPGASPYNRLWFPWPPEQVPWILPCGVVPQPHTPAHTLSLQPKPSVHFPVYFSSPSSRREVQWTLEHMESGVPSPAVEDVSRIIQSPL